MLRSATEAVRARLLSRAPPHLFEEIRNAISLAAAGANREMSRTRDFTAANRFVRCSAKHGKLGEPALMAFAQERKYAETVAALAELSRLAIDVIRPVMQSLRDDGVLIPCRVAGLNWETVAAVLDSRFAPAASARTNWRKAKEQYGRLTVESARRLLKLLAGPRRGCAAEELRDEPERIPSSRCGARRWREAPDAGFSIKRARFALRYTPHPPPLSSGTFVPQGEKETAASRRLGQSRVEMLQPRHHFLLQEPQRILPGFRLVLVVEAEHQERAEAADLVIDLLDLLGDGRRRTDDPVVARAIVGGDVASRACRAQP